MNQRDKSAYVVVAIVLLILVAAVAVVFTSRFQNTTRVILGDAVVSAKIARTDEQKINGLSGVAELKDGEGMLFIYQEDGLHSIWMKDMKINIDIIWLNEKKSVVHIVKNASPESFPKSFKPKKLARYVLEVPAGYTAAKRIAIGTPANFNANALE